MTNIEVRITTVRNGYMLHAKVPAKEPVKTQRRSLFGLEYDAEENEEYRTYVATSLEDALEVARKEFLAFQPVPAVFND